MLHEFLTTHHQELIARCTAKAAHRRKGPPLPTAVVNGVPLFLQQLAKTLRHDQEESKAAGDIATSAPYSAEIDSAASLHGADLLRRGYSIDLVVHDYGDVCQAVTELAAEKKAPITIAEFHTLNRVLDDAIAEAVTAYGNASQATVNGNAAELHEQLNNYSIEQRQLIDIAIQCYAAIKTGDVGISGATGTLLIHALNELRSLADRLLPETLTAAAKTTLAAK
jgi:hypothetical protein